MATEIEELPGVTSTSVSTLGAFSTGGGISVEFDGAMSESEFLKSYDSAVALVKGGSHLYMTDVEYGNIYFEPFDSSFDPAPLLAMKRIPGFSGASFGGRHYVSFDTPLAAVNAVEAIRDQNLVSEKDMGSTSVVSKREGQPWVELAVSKPELAALVPEFLGLPGVRVLETVYGKGLEVTMAPGADPAAAQALAAAKSGPPPQIQSIEVHVIVPTPRSTPSTALP